MYRLVMNFLYTGSYRRRFRKVCGQIRGKQVTELCFGDLLIAEYCREHQIGWQGIDLNREFVSNALKKGFHAIQGDVLQLSLPPADTVIICGSLYHFHEQLEILLQKMLLASSRIILSEPVINLSSRKGIIGKLARASANVNGRKQDFRYTEGSLLAELDRLGSKLGFKYTVTDRFKKDIIIVITT